MSGVNHCYEHYSNILTKSLTFPSAYQRSIKLAVYSDDPAGAWCYKDVIIYKDVLIVL